jgi:hypothetical protein
MKFERQSAESTMGDAEALFPSENEHLRRPATNVMVDDMVWHAPRPLAARLEGWEDDFMRKWKERHYDPTQRLGCKNVDDKDTPYDSYLLCPVPAYVPARLPLDPSSQLITRVIFISWSTRLLGRSMFSSVMSLLLHNPEYELIFFVDDDIDRFVCQNYPKLAPHFSKLRSGASRVDVWRMMVMKQYGGVYLDFDMSAIGHLPIHDQDSVVSGLGCWSHLPSGHGGLFEHWNLAFQPNHPLISTTLEFIERNLRHPTNPNVVSEKVKKAEPSLTMRLTGPMPYQRALHRLLNQAQCQLVDGSFCFALMDPHSHCNFTAFHAIFGNVVVTGRELNNTVTPKLHNSNSEWWFLPGGVQDYDNVLPPSDKGKSNFCLEESLQAREAKRIRLWNKIIKDKQDRHK